MYFPDRGCAHTLLTLYVYATATGSTLPCDVLTQVCTFAHKLRVYQLMAADEISDVERHVKKCGFCYKQILYETILYECYGHGKNLPRVF